MNLIYNVAQVMHRIRVKLYPNYLPGLEGTFLARTDSEASLSIEQVCAAMRDRGGYKGGFGELVENVKLYMNEAAYQLCDGFTVNTGFFSVYPNLGGTFKTLHDRPDPKKNPLSFRFRPLPPLRKLAESIDIIVEGEAASGGYIDEYLDVEEDAANTIFIPGNQFVLSGHKIRIAGEDPACGVYFVPVDDPSKAVKLNHLAENSQSKIIGIAPNTGFALNKVEIRTQYSGSGDKFLKTPRTIASSFIIEEA